MDIIYEMLRQLAVSMSLGTFLLVLAIIVLSSVIIANFFVSRKGGIFSFLIRGDKEPKEPKEQKDSKYINELRETLVHLLDEQSESINRIIEDLHTLRIEEKESGDTIKSQIAGVAELRRDIEIAKLDLTKDIEELKTWFKVHDLQDQQMGSNLKDLMSRVLEILAKMAIQLTAIEEFVRSVGPERRTDHKELVKGISDLSRDIALIERTIQTHVNSNTSGGVKLR